MWGALRCPAYPSKLKYLFEALARCIRRIFLKSGSPQSKIHRERRRFFLPVIALPICRIVKYGVHLSSIS